MTPYSRDLRQRVFATAQRGEGSVRQIARRFLVSVSFVTRLLRTHRTTDFTLPGMTGRWPAGFNDGFLSGASDWPATLYLDPEKETKALPGVRQSLEPKRTLRVGCERWCSARRERIPTA